MPYQVALVVFVFVADFQRFAIREFQAQSAIFARLKIGNGMSKEPDHRCGRRRGVPENTNQSVLFVVVDGGLYGYRRCLEEVHDDLVLAQAHLQQFLALEESQVDILRQAVHSSSPAKGA